MASSFTDIQQHHHQHHQHHHHQHHNQYPVQTSAAPPAPSQQHQSLSSHLGGRELKLIASSFVKQYYTLLNKAPCYIHNFYNHDSTFIHGTIEMGSDDHTEPVVGREKIEEKMRELQLNDCRAKIKQIDCLETLSGGLVLQVIGELSNDGKPMRRFLQTFVLAPSPDQTRLDGDSHTQNRANDNRRGVQISENSANSSHNQKFYVLNSIFRYQDDGTDSEFEDDSVSVRANTSIDNGAEQVETDDHNIRVKAVPNDQLRNQQQQQQQKTVAIASAEQPKHGLNAAPSESAPTSDQQRRNEVKVVASNGTANTARKSEISEKVSNENGKDDNQQSQSAPAPTNNSVETSTTPAVASQSLSTASASAPANAPPATRPSNEPKTWANMVRNAIPPPVTPQISSAVPIKEQPSLNQSNPAQNPSQQQQIPHQHHQQQHQQQQSSQSQNEQQQNNNSNNNNNPNRRRHMIRKASNNKTGNMNGSGSGSVPGTGAAAGAGAGAGTGTGTSAGTGNGTGTGSGAGSGAGRPMKYRPPRPTAAATPTSKPSA